MSKRLIVILLVLLSSYAHAKKDDNAVYEIILQPRPEYEIKGNAIYYRNGKAGMIFELADGDTIGKYYSDRGAPQMGNPFQQDPELQQSTIFLVTLVNKTNGVLTFTPGYVVMKVKDDASPAMDFTQMLTLLESYPQGVRKILDNSIFHSPEAVRPGQVVSKFLFLPALPKKEVDFRIEIDYLYFDHQEVRTKFYYSIRKQK